MTGRPLELTPEIEATIVNAISAGNYLHVAAELAGIHRVTFGDWLRRGAREDRKRKKGKAPDPSLDVLVAFSIACKKALAEAESRAVAVIAVAAQHQWQAAAWWLERKNPQRWGRYMRTELTGAGGAPLPVQSFAQLAQLAEAVNVVPLRKKG